MARVKTVNTPESQEAQTCTFTLPAAKLAELRRVDAMAASCKFHCLLGKGFESLFEMQGWQIPGDKTTLQGLEGKLTDGHFILSSRDKLVQAEVDLPFKSVTNFQLLRLELEGRKGKGFRRELRFTVAFEEIDGCAKLEAFMMKATGSAGSLKVTYLREAVQMELAEPAEEKQEPMTDAEWEKTRARVREGLPTQ